MKRDPLASAIDRNVLWILQRVQRWGPLPLRELERQYGRKVVSELRRRRELRGVETRAGVLYVLGGVGRQALRMDRSYRPTSEATEDAFARRVAYEWYLMRDFSEWHPREDDPSMDGWRDPRAGRDTSERYVALRNVEGVAVERVRFLAKVPRPSVPTVGRAAMWAQWDLPLEVFTTDARQAMRAGRISRHVRVVLWKDVLPELSAPMRKALEQLLDATSVSTRPRRRAAGVAKAAPPARAAEPPAEGDDATAAAPSPSGDRSGASVPSPVARAAAPPAADAAASSGTPVRASEAPASKGPAGSKARQGSRGTQPGSRGAGHGSRREVVVPREVERLVEDLATDRVISLGTAQRVYGVTLATARAGGLLTREV
jgi:hypothetical protein